MLGKMERCQGRNATPSLQLLFMAVFPPPLKSMAAFGIFLNVGKMTFEIMNYFRSCSSECMSHKSRTAVTLERCIFFMRHKMLCLSQHLYLLYQLECLEK